MYNTTSMLRTIELLLGLQPMTHFDAGARPMTAAFQRSPTRRPTRPRSRASRSTDAQSGRRAGRGGVGRTWISTRPTRTTTTS